MAIIFPVIRASLYVVLWLFALVTLGLTGARLRYTTHLPTGDPLNQGRNFFDPIVAELCVSALLTLFWAPFVIHMIHGRHEHKYMSKVWHELIGLSILWLFWLIGAAIATSIWPNLPKVCPQYQACRILTAMVAFAWLGWLTVFALLIVTLMYALANSSWGEPAHGHWVREDPRSSTYSGQYPVRV